MHMVQQQKTQHGSNDEAQKCNIVQMHAMMLLIDDSLTFHVVGSSNRNRQRVDTESASA